MIYNKEDMLYIPGCLRFEITISFSSSAGFKGRILQKTINSSTEVIEDPTGIQAQEQVAILC